MAMICATSDHSTLTTYKTMAAHSGKQLIVVCGPTAAGKTDYAIDLAKRLGTQIISADSRQVFRDIPIGTAQPTARQLATVPHHFIAELGLNEPFSAGIFAQQALKRLHSIFENADLAVICGGTGLYIKALCEGLDDLPTANNDLRTELANTLRNGGIELLQQRLRTLDADAFQTIDINNPQRLMRAIEVCVTTGGKYSHLRTKTQAALPFSVRYVGIDLPREELYARINARTEAMMQQGWLAEAERVIQFRHVNALNTVGYKELFEHIEGKISVEEAVHLIQQNTRRFAKRQLTWFRNQIAAEWVRV